MSGLPETDSRIDLLIDDLAADHRPLTPLAPPWVRATYWLAGVAALALVLATLADLPGIGRRLAAEPDMWLAVVGSTLTTVLATYSAFLLALPDRSRLWAFLPIPALALWIVSSGLGCARTWIAPRPGGALLDEINHCLIFIVAVSLPLSVAMFLMLRRGFSMYPSLTSAIAGLAVASAAATLLNFFHPFDAAFDDLAVHAVAVLLIVGTGRAIGARFLALPRRRGGRPGDRSTRAN
jgi:hypothetical protein